VDHRACTYLEKLQNTVVNKEVRMKSEKQIAEKENEMFNRVWYQRHMHMRNEEKERWEETPNDIKQRALVHVRQVERMVEHETRERDRVWYAQREGWLAALRWVLDGEATERTDWLYDT